MPLFNLQNLMPHGYCLSWGSVLLWMHVISDALITLSYFSIPIMLAYFLRQRKDFPYPWLIALFATFIVACGTTHLLAAITIWIPLYWLEGYLKVLTALVSIASVIVLSEIIPQALQLTSPKVLEAEIERRKILGQERQAALSKLEKISNRLPGMVFQFRLLPDGSSYFPYCSEGVKDVFRLSPEEVKADASKLFSRIHPDDNDFVMNSIDESSQHLTINHYPFRVQFEDGEERWLMVNAKPEREENSSTLWHGFISDITQQKKTENDILKKEALNQELEELVQERTLKLQEVNNEYLALNETLAETIEKEVQSNREKDGMLVQQSRLAAMGEMIGNIAHQWRQPLNNLNLVLGNIEDAHEYNELTTECLHEQIALANNLIQTMSSTIDDFRNFFKSDSQQELFDIGNAVRDALTIVEASFKSNNIAVEFVAHESIRVYGFKGQYRQVMLNILGNAKDALVERHVRNAKITITLANENEFAVARIRDNAGGIAADVIQKIFDPYFTTRPEGNGIGLYMSKMIIENNMHGVLYAENTENGAEFVIKVKIG